MAPLSVVIIAKNEAGRIKDCIESVHEWADEIVVIDDESTDNTRAIALKYTPAIYSRRMELEGKQRNFAASQAKNDWIMLLDCDERPTPELKEEIAAVLKEPDPKIAAYWAPQINYLGDMPLLHGGWSSPHIRLYNKNRMSWSEAVYDVIHPGIKTKEGFRGGHLKSATIHYSFRNVEDLVAKINRYSTMEAFKWYMDKRDMPLIKALWRAWDRFFRRLVAKKGYKDGYFGFVAAVVSSFNELAVYSKYREMKEKGHYLDRFKAKGLIA
ncbi:MAG: glycosyltransferase family 2 protein [Candidatus Omnitrophica bacterium]|nr:glycosyltransferase family 2 protein [Candidatus Omnitrophota bacterium]MDE2222206.1 glycosyltransferase family 2 protein [Candidatus Omnitrophota bacterium]